MTTPDPDREEDLARIRSTYQAYQALGRDRLWDPRNPGYRRLAAERTDALVTLILESLGAAGSVLDLGCGTGDLFEDARAAGVAAQWTGVDLLPEPLEVARGRYPSARWIEASADRIPLRDASVEVVVASTLFSSLPSPEFQERVAAEVGRVLRPAGWLIWYDIRYPSPSNRSVHAVTPSQLTRLFDGWSSDLSTITLLPPIARRLGRATSVLYGMLAAPSPMRSHLVGRLQKPPY